MTMRRILAFALSALQVCVVATAKTDESKLPMKKRPTTTKTETKRSSAKEEKTQRIVKWSEPKTSNSPTAQASSSTPNVLTIYANGVRFEMVEVRGGTFRMGATSEQGGDACDNERPVHNVTLDSYYIGKTEVTQALWKAVMGSNPSHFQGDNLPVECVSWGDCQTFIEKLNALTGKSFRLPTEAEWEFACRGGNKSRGNKYSGSNDLNRVAWYGDNSGSRTHTVATKLPNELGIYDMSGNVWEWCADWYDGYSGKALSNPSGPTSGSGRVNRGGSWINFARFCRTSDRVGNHATRLASYLGLRLVVTIQR